MNSVFEVKCSVLTGSDDDSDDEDDTAALMAELAKVKQERAEEKARIVSPIRLVTNPFSIPFFSLLNIHTFVSIY